MKATPLAPQISDFKLALKAKRPATVPITRIIMQAAMLRDPAKTNILYQLLLVSNFLTFPVTGSIPRYPLN